MSTDLETEPDAPPAKPTETEIRSALERLRKRGVPQQRVARAAKLLISYHRIIADQMEPQDLMSLAAVAILEGKRDWDPSRADFTAFFIGVMRSLAFNETRKAQETQPQYTRESDLGEPGASEDGEGFIALAPGETPTPEQELLNAEDRAEQDALVAIVRAQLSDDPEVMRVLELELEGIAKKEIRRRLGMESQRFWTIDRRIVRALEAAARRRTNHDD